MAGFICGTNVHEYDGWVFEVHSYCGPWPLKRDGGLRARAGRKFYDMWDRFKKEPNKDKFIWQQGGCRQIGQERGNVA